MSSRLIHQDRRWPEFIERYAHDLFAFATEVCGITLSPELKRCYGIAQKGGRAIFVDELMSCAPHGFIQLPPITQPIALWHLLCRQEFRTFVVLPVDLTRRQYDVLIRQVLAGPHGWVGEYIHSSKHEIHLGERGVGPQILFLNPSRHEVLDGCRGKGALWLLEDAQAIKTESLERIMASISPGARSVVMSTRELPSFEDVSLLAPGRWDIARRDWAAVLQTIEKTAS